MLNRVDCYALQPDDSIIIVDVRDEDRCYGFGHISGSWHVPSESFAAAELLDAIEERAPLASRLVFHCAQSRQRGPSCAASTAKAIRERGAKLTCEVLAGGFDEWYEAALPRCFCEGQECRKGGWVVKHTVDP